MGDLTILKSASIQFGQLDDRRKDVHVIVQHNINEFFEGQISNFSAYLEYTYMYVLNFGSH